MQKRGGIWRYKDGGEMTIAEERRNDGYAEERGIWRYKDGEGSLPVRGMMMKKKTRRDGWGYSKL